MQNQTLGTEMTDSTDTERSKIDILTPTFGFHQIINEASLFLNNSSSCIDLIFTSQPNLVTESGVHYSLHANCHHQIIYAKFNLNVIHPPPCEREAWHYKLANSENVFNAQLLITTGKKLFIILM